MEGLSQEQIISLAEKQKKRLEYVREYNKKYWKNKCKGDEDYKEKRREYMKNWNQQKKDKLSKTA